MKKLLLIITIFFSFMTSLSASYLIDVYYARISEKDHYSSSGIHLNSVSAILRQDRANYHKFYRRDREDSYDTFFKYKRNRAKFRYFTRYNSLSYRTRQSILYGNPLLKIKIYNNHILVTKIRNRY